MRFKNCTLGFVKNLYMKKVAAEENGDEQALMTLKAEYPELFDAKFLMDVLKCEFNRLREGLDDDVIFQTNLFQYH